MAVNECRHPGRRKGQRLEREETSVDIGLKSPKGSRRLTFSAYEVNACSDSPRSRPVRPGKASKFIDNLALPIPQRRSDRAGRYERICPVGCAGRRGRQAIATSRGRGDTCAVVAIRSTSTCPGREAG